MSLRRTLWLAIILSLTASLIIAGCSIPTSNDGVRTELVTVIVRITNTPDPDATPEVIIITATPDRTQVNVPDGIVPEGSNTDGTPQVGTTQIPDADIDAETVSASGISAPDGCLIHIVDEGDTFFGVAEEYEVNPFVMLEINGRTEEDAFLNIGDELIVPLDTCPIEQIIIPTEFPIIDSAEITEEVTVEVTEEITEEVNLTPSPTPTVTLAPTATSSEIEIVEVIRAGDVTAEGLRIRNNGRLVDVVGWTLSDADGNEFVFGEFFLFSNAEHTIYTRASQNTAIASFWGLEEPVWQPGDVATLRDSDGDVQAVYRIPSDVEAP